jgi:hypothetical protein
VANPSKKRQLLYLPAINTGTFLFFFQKGDDQRSWSLRDYSEPHRCGEWYAKDYGVDATEILAQARHAYDAETVSTKDLAYWHQRITELNRRHNLAPHAPSGQVAAAEFPILADAALRAHAKAAKPQDMRRIRTSPNSEDWVTWNLLQLLRQRQPDNWWLHLSPNLWTAGELPSLHFWRHVAAPPAYEKASRHRMRNSPLATDRDRAADPQPVEGKSEIDVVLESANYLVFLEAKLGSDISASTSYDPSRNQIARNIDCAIETAGSREPIFWMLVRDCDAKRAYVQMMDAYQQHPDRLHRDLPHRPLAQLQRIAQRLAIFRWRDLAGEWLQAPDADPLTESVRQELLRRI